MDVPSPASAPATSRAARAAGFSLIEILIVLLIASIMLALAYWILMANTSVSRIGLQRATLFATARNGRALLANDFKAFLGPMKNPVSTPYPDRDPGTLAPTPATGVPRGALIVVPGLRQGTLPESAGRLVNLRCDQLFFLADTANGGAGIGGMSAYPSLTSPNRSSTQAAVWIGPVTDGDQTQEAITWTVGRQAVLLNDGSSGWPSAIPFDGVSLSPTNAARRNSDLLNTALTSVSDWLLAKSPAPGLPTASHTSLINAFTVPVPTTPMPFDGPSGGWPTLNSNALEDGTITSSDVTDTQRLLFRHCSEVIVQVSIDGNCNGLPDTTNLLNGVADPKNAAPWDGATLPKRDLAGDILWVPSDQDVNDNVAGARDPRVFWPQDAQPRIVHFGYYQGPSDSVTGKAPSGAYGYWQNRWGDWTPYPPVSNFPNSAYTQLPDGTAPSAFQFGDMVAYGDYVPRAWDPAATYAEGDIVTHLAGATVWNAATTYAAGNIVSYGAGYYTALAANTNIAPLPITQYWRPVQWQVYKALVATPPDPAPPAPPTPHPEPTTLSGWIQVTGDEQLSSVDYAQAMGNYAMTHGWNPSNQNPAYFPLVSASDLKGLPPPAQSTWPSLLRIRVRLHDRGGAVRAYDDSFLTNHRNDNGEPSRADNADDPAGDEARASGLWFEYVFSLPYPRLKTGSMPSPPGTSAP